MVFLSGHRLIETTRRVGIYDRESTPCKSIHPQKRECPKRGDNVALRRSARNIPL